MPRDYIAKEETYDLAVKVVTSDSTECTNIDLSDSDVAYIKAADAFVQAYGDWVDALYRRVDKDALRHCAVCERLIGLSHHYGCIWTLRGLPKVTADHVLPPTVEELANQEGIS